MDPLRERLQELDRLLESVEEDQLERKRLKDRADASLRALHGLLGRLSSDDQARLERLNAPLPEPREEDAIYRIRKTLAGKER